jgi:predicted ATPase
MESTAYQIGQTATEKESGEPKMRYNLGHQADMQLEPVIRNLTIKNLLSFGEEATMIELRSLNVLIGPNGSGKSNLIEVLGLLQNAPKELATAISYGGPIDEWLWKGATKTPTASIEALISPARGPKALRYRLAFTKAGFRFEITDERLENEEPLPDKQRPYFYYAYVNGRPMLNYRGEERRLQQEEINPQLSILAQRKDPDHYPEITYLGDLFARFRLYRDWEFGAGANVREPCDAGLPSEYLEEDGSNLGVVLDRLLARPPVKHQILDSLRTFYENTKDLRTSIEGGKVQVRLEEKHLNATIPLIRMSDGTIRWLALLAILLNPDPPPLVVIEEPELGLHPDMIHELGRMLIDASTRMQIIVTTHSDRLVEEFTERPEAVLVCEKETGASTFLRLDPRQLSSWIEEYSLGQLWTKGQIGGTRW